MGRIVPKQRDIEAVKHLREQLARDQERGLAEAKEWRLKLAAATREIAKAVKARDDAIAACEERVRVIREDAQRGYEACKVAAQVRAEAEAAARINELTQTLAEVRGQLDAEQARCNAAIEEARSYQHKAEANLKVLQERVNRLVRSTILARNANQDVAQVMAEIELSV